MEVIDRNKVDQMRAESVKWKDIATDQKVSYSTLLRHSDGGIQLNTSTPSPRCLESTETE